MGGQPRVKFKVVDEKPVLEVTLPTPQIRELGQLKGDNIETLRQLGDRIPKILSIGARKKLPKGRSLRRLFSIYNGTAGMGAKNAGSNVTIVLKDNSGGEIYRATPQEPKLVADLRSKVGEIKKSVKHDHKILGMPGEQTDAVVKEVDEEFEKYRKVFELSQKGLPPRKIAEEMKEDKIKKFTVNAWLTGEDIPFRISRLDPEFKSKYLKPVNIPREESKDFAYILGAHAAVTRRWNKSDGLLFQHTDRRVIKKVRDAINSVFKEDADIRTKRLRGVKYHTTSFYSNRLVYHLNNITDGNTRPPWEHLVTRDEKVEFMKGFFDFTGSITHTSKEYGGREVKYPRILAIKFGNEGLIKELAVLLKDVGILPTVNLKKTSLSIHERRDLKTFAGYGGFTSRSMRKKLNALTKVTCLKERYPAEDYYNVINYKKANPNATSREVSKAIGIPYGRVCGWLNGSQKPQSVKKLETISEFERNLPDRDAIGYLFRFGADSSLARKIAEKNNFQDVKRRCELLKQIKIMPNRLRQKLGSIFGISTVDAGIPRPPYAGDVDQLIGGWGGFKIPCDTAEAFIRHLAGRRYASKGEGIEETKRREEEIRGYILGRMLNENLDAYGEYTAYISTPRDIEEDDTFDLEAD